jgi:hypothetical protein
MPVGPSQVFSSIDCRHDLTKPRKAADALGYTTPGRIRTCDLRFCNPLPDCHNNRSAEEIVATPADPLAHTLAR